MKMHIEEYGPVSGLPVIFIHGFPFSSEMWKPQVEALKGSYRTIVYDVRGHGKTEAGDGRYTVELFVDDLVELLDGRRIDRAVVVGLSMGGYIALRLAERNPERLRGLVLCDTRSEADTSEIKVRRAALAREVEERGTKVFAENFVKGVFAPETFQKKPEIVGTMKDIIEHNPVAGITGTLMALASRTDTTASLSNIRVPTLILVGEHDGSTPVEAARAMHQRISGSTMKIIPHAGHLSTLENPDAANPAIVEFLRNLT